MTHPDLLFLENYDICRDFKPHEMLLFHMLGDLQRADRELKKVDCVVKGMIEGDIQRQHLLVDFRYHVDGLAEGSEPARSTKRPKDDALAVRPSHNFNCYQPQGTPQYNPITFSYNYHPQGTKDLERDLTLKAEFMPDWQRD
jgi:hypothetical protein